MGEGTMLLSVETDGSVEKTIEAMEAMVKQAGSTAYIEDGAGNLKQKVSLWQYGQTSYITIE